MPFPNRRLRLGFRPCDNLSLCSLSSQARKTVVRTPLQRRIIATAVVPPTPTGGSVRPNPSHRSPHQWAHIAHHIRKPSVLSASSTMAKDYQPNPAQARTHMGHSHGHHHHDNTYLTSSNKNDPGVRITRIGLYVNLGMAVAKGAGGYIFNSQA